MSRAALPGTISAADLDSLDFEKSGGLLPAIVQDAASGAVLMLGYMNAEALAATFARQRVVFFSRSRQELWEKGETSGNTLALESVRTDCDRDALLILARPAGPTCHLGSASCFGHSPASAAEPLAFLARLEGIIAARIAERPEGSYTAKLFGQGLRRMAQKVGEEGLEVALAAIAEGDAALLGECADLLYHLALLLAGRDLSLDAVVSELERRHTGAGRS